MAGNVDIATLTAKLVMDTKGFSAGIDTATQQVGRITKDNAWSEAGKSLNTLAKGATIAGGAIVAGAGVATKAAIDFEDAFAGVKKTVDFKGTQEEQDAFFASLEKGIREMSTHLPVTAVEIAGVTEAAGQLGIQNDKLLDFTEVMIGLGSATNITAQDAAVSLAQFANVTKMSQDDFDNLGASIVALGNNMATDEKSIVDMSTEMAILRQSCGMSEADILGLSAAMSSMGLESAASGTAMQRLTQEITKSVAGAFKYTAEEVELFNKAVTLSGKELDSFAEANGYTTKQLKDMTKDFFESQESLEMFAKTAGMSSEEFVQAWGTDATEAFIRFIEGLGSKESYEQIAIFDFLDIKQMREIDMLQRLAGNSELVRKAVDMSNEAWNENTALSEEVGKRNETTASQLQMVKNMLTDIAVEAGQALLPVVRQLLEQARPLLEQVSNYLKEHPDTVVRIAEVGAKLLVIGTAVSGIIKVVTAIGSFITTIKTLGTAISVIAGGGGAAAAGGAVAGGGGLIAGLIGGLSGILPVLAAVAAAVGVFAIAWHNDWFGIQEKFGAVKEWIVGKFGELKAAFEEGGLQGVIQKIGSDISGWWNNTAAPWFANLDATITEWFQGVFNTIVSWWENTVNSIGEWLANIWNSVTEFFANTWNKTTETLSNVWNKVSETFSKIWNTVTEKLTAIWNKTTETLTSIWNTVTEKLTSIWNTVTEKITSIWNTFKEKMSSILETAKEKMSSIKETITTKATETWNKAKTTLSTAASNVGTIFSNILSTVKSKMESIKGAVESAVERIKSALSSIGEAISNAWEKVKNFASDAWDTLSGLFGGGDESSDYDGAYASGGHVSAGGTYLVGEEGPELFVPNTNGYILSNEDTMDALGGSGEINIYIQGDVYDDEISMRRKIKSAMLDVIREQVAYG